MTPVNVRSAKRISLDDALREHVHKRMARHLGDLAPLVERSTVRFEDINGKRGGIDAQCSIKVVLSSRPSVVVEQRAATAREAFDVAVGAAARAVRHALARAEISTREPRAKRSAARRERGSDKTPAVMPNPPPENGSYIGARVGHAPANLDRAAQRPEKQRRDSLVDTAQAGVSATDRKAGGGSTARRNTKRNLAGLTSALEDSAQPTPSRKSTRRSAGRAKRDSSLQLRELRKLHSPAERARRN